MISALRRDKSCMEMDLQLTSKAKCHLRAKSKQKKISNPRSIIKKSSRLRTKRKARLLELQSSKLWQVI